MGGNEAASTAPFVVEAVRSDIVLGQGGVSQDKRKEESKHWGKRSKSSRQGRWMFWTYICKPRASADVEFVVLHLDQGTDGVVSQSIFGLATGREELTNHDAVLAPTEAAVEEA